jgi:DNA-binding NtrC family response regulator
MQVESVYFSSIGAQAYNWPGNAHELQNAVLDEAVVVQALGLQDKAIIAPTLNRRQR